MGHDPLLVFVLEGSLVSSDQGDGKQKPCMAESSLDVRRRYVAHLHVCWTSASDNNRMKKGITDLYSTKFRMQVCVEILLYASADYRFILQLVDVSFDIRPGPGDNVRPSPATIRARLPSDTLVSALPEIVRPKAG